VGTASFPMASLITRERECPIRTFDYLTTGYLCQAFTPFHHTGAPHGPNKSQTVAGVTCVCVCVSLHECECVRDGERKRQRKTETDRQRVCVCVCVCVCVRLCVRVCVCVPVYMNVSV